jgi:phosphoglycerate dehydrogenase-like enzyme
MNRRHFLAASAAAATLNASAAPGAAGSANVNARARLKVILPTLPAEQLSDLAAVSSDIELVPCQNEQEALALVKDADASYAYITRDIIRAGKSLRWVQQPSAGVEHLIEIPELVHSDIVLTNMQRVYAPEIADQAMAYLLAFTRGLGQYLRPQPAGGPSGAKEPVLDELAGKSMFVIGLGGIGTEIARRAHAFGMLVVASDPKVWERPPYVEELQKPEAFARFLSRADVVASAAPLTRETRRLIGPRAFDMMKQDVILINVSRGGVVDTDALLRALERKRVAAAGLDVTDPEPLPKGHPLWSQNVIITPHTAGQSPAGIRRRHELLRENLRRFARGEMLLNVVDKTVGY